MHPEKLGKVCKERACCHTPTPILAMFPAAPREDASILSQHHHVVVPAAHLSDRVLQEELQQYRLQDLHAQLAIHSNAAIIV